MLLLLLLLLLDVMWCESVHVQKMEKEKKQKTLVRC